MIERCKRIPPRPGHPPIYSVEKPRTSGRCASPAWAPAASFPANRTAGKAGKTPRCRRKNSAAICALIRADRDVRLRRPLYGHFGHGCVHMRINFDLETEPGIQKYRKFIDRAADIVISHGGSLSGEHGDGQSRAALLPKMFGPELMQAFREFKAVWDPDNKMNPGKLSIDRRQARRKTCASAPDYKPQQPKTHFQFPDDDGSLRTPPLRCVGVGACRKDDGGAMCPSYMATREEKHSTRGRAHLLWEMLQGEVRPGRLAERGRQRGARLCLSCKACKTECPVNVDIATYKAEFLSHYYGPACGRSTPMPSA